ncbi:MAG: T9SS type A sorting domain-containing protein [Bacteroidales bacterium]
MGIVLCLCTFSTYAETISKDTTGFWTDNSTWENGAKPTQPINTDIIINGTISTEANQNLFFTTNSSLTVHDTLIINGNLSAEVNIDFTVEEDGILIVLGNYTSENNIDIAANGKIVIFGDFTHDKKNIDVTIPSDNNLYVFGDPYVDKNANIDQTQIGDQESFLSGEPELTEWLDDNYNTLLPIRLTDFSAFASPKGIEYTWITESEEDNDYFTLEYSTNGTDFTPITTIPGKGTTSQSNYYAYFDDHNKQCGTIYCRLKQTDFNGTSTYSQILSIQVPNYNTDIFLYPNPVSDYLYINDNTKTISHIRFFDAQFKKLNITHSHNIYDVKKLEKGTYFVEIQTETKRFMSTFIKK